MCLSADPITADHEKYQRDLVAAGLLIPLGTPGLYGRSGIAHFAHLGGMLGGFLMIRYWRGQAPFGGRRQR